VLERALENISRGTPINFVFANLRGGTLKGIHPIPKFPFVVYLLGSFFSKVHLYLPLVQLWD